MVQAKFGTPPLTLAAPPQCAQGEMVQAKFGIPAVALRQLEVLSNAVLRATLTVRKGEYGCGWVGGWCTAFLPHRGMVPGWGGVPGSCTQSA